jgi:glutathione S-transferase
MQLFDSAFSPFARKVRMVLEFKGLEFQVKDELLKANHADLKAVNGRGEVPTLVDGDTVVVNSSDIVSYLEHRYPDRPVYPDAPDARVHARAWERTADGFIDPILVDISYWKWAERPDTIPTGLLDAARADLSLVYDSLEAELTDREYVSGPLSIADMALFPHIASARAMEVGYSRDRYPGITSWFARMRSLPICAADLKRTRDFMADMGGDGLEKKKIFWRGDRVEWILARGFHDWFFNEIQAHRVLWPGPALPAPLKRTTTR